MPRIPGAALLVTVAVAALLSLAALAAAAQPAGVLVSRVDGPITPVAAAHVDEAVERAESGPFQALVLELDTPGGLDSSMRDIVQALLGARVPVVVHVAPSGARAASAGAIIAMAAHVVAMAPGTAIGAATPIDLEGGEVLDKVVEDAAAYARAVAEARDRPVDFAVAAVREGRSIPASRALELGVADVRAATRAELLAVLHGREVRLEPAGGSPDIVRLSTLGAAETLHQMSWLRRLLQAVADPNLAFLFLSLGTLALLVELTSPGGGLAGAVGIVLVVLALFSLAVLPVDLAGVVLLALAAALFAAELFAPGIGVFAAGGALALLFAGLLLFDEASGLRVAWSALLPLVLLLGAGAVLLGRMVVRLRRTPPYEGPAGALVGAAGQVRAGAGAGEAVQVWVAGALWRGRAETALRRGDRVRVAGMDGLELRLEPEREGPEGEAP